MPERAENLVSSWVERTYLARDRWWAQLVLDEFDFLTQFGFSVTDGPLAGVHFHQEGNWISFERPNAYVTIGYGPDDGGGLSLSLRTPDGNAGSLDSMIDGAGSPDCDARDVRDPRHRGQVEAKVRWWAAELQTLAPRFFGPRIV